jgi:hypothetical protein
MTTPSRDSDDAFLGGCKAENKKKRVSRRGLAASTCLPLDFSQKEGAILH